jgi:histone demethylase JARID1
MEEMYAYSINYLYTGAARTWYVIPSQRSDALGGQDEVARKLKDNLNLDISSSDFVLDPVILKQQGITFYKVVQCPGQFVILLPNVYYFHFSHGVRIQKVRSTTTRIAN